MINKHKSNKIKENSNTVRHWNNGTDHRHSKSCCDQSSPARRTMNLWSVLWRKGLVEYMSLIRQMTLRPSDAIWHRHSHAKWHHGTWSSLVQIMAHLLRSDKLSSGMMMTYCIISNISGTKSPNLNVSRLVMQLSLPNPMKPGVKLSMKM